MNQQIDHIWIECFKRSNQRLDREKNDSDEHSPEQSDELAARPIRRRLNRSFPLNRSKLLNDEQRDQVLQFASDNKDEIMNQPSCNRICFFQNLVRERLNINLSLSMSGKVIQIIMHSMWLLEGESTQYMSYLVEFSPWLNSI